MGIVLTKPTKIMIKRCFFPTKFYKGLKYNSSSEFAVLSFEVLKRKKFNFSIFVPGPFFLLDRSTAFNLTLA